MEFDAILLKEKDVSDLRLQIDEFNRVEPIKATKGTDKDDYYLHADIEKAFPQLKDKLDKGSKKKLKTEDLHEIATIAK